MFDLNKVLFPLILLLIIIAVLWVQSAVPLCSRVAAAMSRQPPHFYLNSSIPSITMSYSDCLCLTPTCSCPLKQDTGCVPSLSTPVQSPTSQRKHLVNLMESPTSRDNERLEKEDSSIGNSFWHSKSKSVGEALRACSLESTPSPPDRKLRKTTSGRKPPGYPIPSSPMEQSPSREIPQRIGISYEDMLKEEISSQFPVICSFVIMPISEEFIQTLLNRLPFFGLAGSFTEELELASLELLGNLPDPLLTLRIPGRSGGMATKTLILLSSMSSEDPLISRTYYAGWTDIQCLWRLKVPASPYLPPNSGYVLTSPPENATQTLMKQQWPPSSDDWL